MPDDKPVQTTLLAGEEKAADSKPANAGGEDTTADATAAAKDGGKPAEEKKEEVKYELKAPEGRTLEPGYLEGIAAFAKERGLSNEVAQALLERELSATDSYDKTMASKAQAQITAWAEETKGDKEVGGERLAENLEMGRRALNHFDADGSLTKLLKDSGLGNKVELVRVFARIGKMMADDKLVLPGTQGTGSKTDAELFYKNTSTTHNE